MVKRTLNKNLKTTQQEGLLTLLTASADGFAAGDIIARTDVVTHRIKAHR